MLWDGLGVRERGCLYLAALLHDIGWSQTRTGKGHHKISARMIVGYAWKELGGAEVALVSQIARYHRKKLPAEKHAAYQALPVADREAVDRLAALLRIADALDRTHTGRIAAVRASVFPDRIEIAVTPATETTDWQAEHRMAGAKKDLLERTTGVPVRVEGA